MALILTKDKKTPKIYKYILNRIKYNQNFLVAITGGTGSGKSYSALSMAEDLSKLQGIKFDINNVCYTGLELMQRINNKDEPLPKGSVLIMDESGSITGINARNWQSQNNILLSSLVMTFRHRNYIVIFCVPDLTFVDVSIRKMIHAHFQTNGFDRQEKICWLKPLFLTFNKSNGDIYQKYLRYVNNGDIYTIDNFGLYIPSKELIKQYEERKTSFTDKLNAYVEKVLHQTDVFENNKVLKEKSIYTLLEQECTKLLNQGLNHRQIAERLHLKESSVSRALNNARFKQNNTNNELFSV